VSYAAQILRNQFDLFINFEDVQSEDEEKVDAEFEEMYKNLTRSVEELELSVRSQNCLNRVNIRQISDLVQKTEAEMLRTRNFGRKSLNEIKDVLASMNLTFGMDVEQFGITPTEIEEIEQDNEEPEGVEEI